MTMKPKPRLLPAFLDFETIDRLWQWDRSQIEAFQLDRLNTLLARQSESPFYRQRFGPPPWSLDSLEQLSELPTISKADLVADLPGVPGRVFANPLQDYTRFHQTSGTSGHPMPVLDTPEDWHWWLNCWQHVLRAADIRSSDIAMMAFSFGPFIGFWTASDALVQAGALVVPGGGMSTETRLQMILDHRCTVVCCTPTYALHMMSTAQKLKIDLPNSTITRLIVAGEPGGSQPSIRSRIEVGWGARVIDHSGASEIGAWGFGTRDGSGLHVIETEFIAERLCFDAPDASPRVAADGEEAELVLTGLGRHGGPVIRYRTGDIVRSYQEHKHDCRFLFLDGGVLGRSDDMIVVRGVNVFPSSIEAIVRQVDASCEFQVTVTKHGELDTIEMKAELSETGCQRLAELLQNRLAMKVRVRATAPESLPRFEAKAKRWIDQRRDRS